MKASQLKVTEKSFQRKVMQYAKLRGWSVVHFTAAQNARGRHMTPVQGDAGSPDLLLAKNGRVVLLELKGDGGRTQANQREWAQAITGHAVVAGDAYDMGSHRYALVYPRHWPTIELILS